MTSKWSVSVTNKTNSPAPAVVQADLYKVSKHYIPQ